MTTKQQQLQQHVSRFLEAPFDSHATHAIGELKKFLTLSINILTLVSTKVVKSFLTILTCFSEIEPRPIKKLEFFGTKNHKIYFFFYFFITKTSDFISNINDDFYEDSFEVYNIFLG